MIKPGNVYKDHLSEYIVTSIMGDMIWYTCNGRKSSTSLRNFQLCITNGDIILFKQGMVSNWKRELQ